MPQIEETTAGVKKLLEYLQPHKVCGPDQLPHRVLKELADVITHPLREIFQACLDTSTVPHQLRLTNVTPVFKKCDRSSAANYQPVFLTCICCILNEHIIGKTIVTHFDLHNILTDSQHGFR